MHEAGDLSLTSLTERARVHIPGGVNSNVRLSAPPVYWSRGEGARLWSTDGRDYIDYVLGQGPAFLGHAHPKVLEAVRAACRRGTILGGQHPLEVEAAEHFHAAVGWPDMVRFGLTGTEMVQAALRLARAATGRRRFVRFEGHYHGWLDDVLIAPRDGGFGPASEGQLESGLDNSVILPWNDLPALEEAMSADGSDIAALIMEPVAINTAAALPRDGYLEGVRDLCDRTGTVLVFDEVITGFRLALGGAVERFGVVPDLATYGKALAGGFPVAALAGAKELMERFGTGEVNHSGTFNASTMACAAVIASLEVLRDDPPYDRVEQYGRRLMAALVDLGADHQLPVAVQGVGAAFNVALDPSGAPAHSYRDAQRFDAKSYRQLVDALFDAGLWVTTRGIWFVSAAHGENEFTETLERAAAAFAEFRARA